MIYRTGKTYNDSHILVEINDIGGQVADALHHDMAYENIINDTDARSFRADSRVRVW